MLAGPALVGFSVRLAFFGGSFDPPHRGHLAIALAAADRLSLDRVLFAPTGYQPLKRSGAVAGFADRLAMVELLCLAHPDRFAPSALDAPHLDGSPNYTVNALEALQHQNPAATLFSIVGADSLLELPNWRAAPRLLELANWIAVSRPHVALPATLPKILDDALTRKRLHLIADVHLPISSTELRERLHAGEDCRDTVPERVRTYIRAHGLYT